MTHVRRGTRVLLAAAGVAAVLLGPTATAEAHPLSTSAVLLDVDRTVVTATVELPLDELSVARDQTLTATTVVEPRTLADLRAYVQGDLSASDAGGRTWTTAVTGGRVERVDGVDDLVLDATLTPASGLVGDFVLHDDGVMDELMSHRVFVSGRYGHVGAYTTLAMLSWQSQTVPVASAPATGSGTSAQGFVAAVRLGVHHIATGSDHLLFLIMLLLPAPLVAAGRRWRGVQDSGAADTRRAVRRVVHVVTAFAVGHSCTLVLGALGWVTLPPRLVESGIAVSVLVSAIHAVRPLVRRGEVLIAGGFGLLHGLAFAALLGSLDLSRSSLVTTLLGFNVGIELSQLLVVALVMPSLLLLARTPAYGVVRLGAAALGALLATGWVVNRVGLIPANPLEPMGDLLVDHPLALALGLGLLAAGVAGGRRVSRFRTA
ncbi:MAG TPA: HupE/UreJ family protein [Friedmanniella sp.]